MTSLNRLTESCVPCQNGRGNTPRGSDQSGNYVRTNETVETIECNKKIISITKVNDRVVVMYDDCSYGIAPIDVVAKEAFNSEKIEALEKQNKELQDKVTALENKPDKDTIYDDTNIRNEITNLKVELSTVVKKSDLIVVENLEGTKDLFRAIPLEGSNG